MTMKEICSALIALLFSISTVAVAQEPQPSCVQHLISRVLVATQDSAGSSSFKYRLR